jgi:hypothetical protein
MSRARKGVSRTLSPLQIEERLDEILRIQGEPAVQRLRDEARIVSQQLEMPAEFQSLDQLIGSLLGTRKATLKSSVGVARATGLPYDPFRLDLFQRLFTELSNSSSSTRPQKPTDGPALPFFETYFSNFIEGTEFAVNEAEAIIFEGRIPAARPADAHDVLGTWRVVSDMTEMSRLPKSLEQLFELLATRHASVMEGRPDKSPGLFKADINRAGSTYFVAPDLVRGTLAMGFEIYRGLTVPFQRAVFMMFLISEVHPFSDGNGRVARIMMNAELIAERESRIIVPTVYRNNYLQALKALSQSAIVSPIVRALDFAQRYTAAVDFSSVDTARTMLQRTHAFDDANEAENTGIRLVLPSPEVLA